MTFCVFTVYDFCYVIIRFCSFSEDILHPVLENEIPELLVNRLSEERYYILTSQSCVSLIGVCGPAS